MQREKVFGRKKAESILYGILKRSGVVFVTVLTVAVSLFLSGRQGMTEIMTAAGIDMTPTVIIDAGHGGFDGGAVANDGTVEKDINLNISLMLCDMLKYSGYNVIMTRTDDTATDDILTAKIPSRKKSDLQNRLKLMDDNPDAVYVSIHLNKFTTSAANGAQVFYSGNFSESAALGEYIQSSIVSKLQPENNRVIKKGTSSTYLLYNAKVPAVIVECGFLSNTSELIKLKDEKYQSKMAFCIACGISDFFTRGE